jgi:chemosensory pili system protein ChpA (sensor histidine kinase/response regulator)
MPLLSWCWNPFLLWKVSTPPAKPMKLVSGNETPINGAEDSSRDRRILFVDDNVQLQSILKIGLERCGFEVITASDGIDALMQFKAHSGDFGAIVTDNDMPRMNGLELVWSVREMGFRGRIIIISSLLNREDLRAYQEYAISGFFHKPFDLDLLATMLLHAD